MKLNLTLAASLAVIIATAATADQVLNDLTAAQEAYVDPNLRTRDRCLDRPGHAGWMMVQPLGYEWRVDLANKFRTFQRSQAITEAGICNCDLLYPDWDVFREEVEAMWNEVSTERKWDWNDEARQRFYAAQDGMTDYSDPLLQDTVDLCERVE